MVPFTTFFCTLYHHAHAREDAPPRQGGPRTLSFHLHLIIPGRSYTRNVATAFPTITARWLNDGGVLAGQADFGERALRDFCGTYVRRCVDMGGAGDRASFGQAEVHTERTAWGAGLLHERRPRTKCDPSKSVPFLQLEAI